MVWPRRGATSLQTATEFEDALEGLRATRASPGARQIVEALKRHGREEAEVIERYNRLEGGTHAPAVQYLVQLIVEDERRHHRILKELANTIAWNVLAWSPGTRVPEKVVPVLSKIDRDDRSFWAETKGLLKHERDDRARLRALRRQLRKHYSEDLWLMLLDLLIIDTTKHIKILQFLLNDRYP